jgi:hypothetical protein
MAPHHQLELRGQLALPYPFVASSPSKDRPKSGFPKHDVGLRLRWVTLHMILGAIGLPGHVVA